MDKKVRLYCLLLKYHWLKKIYRLKVKILFISFKLHVIMYTYSLSGKNVIIVYLTVLEWKVKYSSFA